MKPPVENIKVTSKSRDILIQAKRQTGLKQWNELLRWAFCISLANPDLPRINRKLDSGIEPIEWVTFSGSNHQIYAALFYKRATVDGIELGNEEAVACYFRAHIERGIGALRSFKSLENLTSFSL
ncbi:MAG: DndE family protein [Verrucomicrobiae bacterium]|nr:DndE family protein [Verrucomicrobiae bacterium]